MIARCYESASWARCVVPPYSSPCSTGWWWRETAEACTRCARFVGDGLPLLEELMRSVAGADQMLLLDRLVYLRAIRPKLEGML